MKPRPPTTQPMIKGRFEGGGLAASAASVGLGVPGGTVGGAPGITGVGGAM